MLRPASARNAVIVSLIMAPIFLAAPARGVLKLNPRVYETFDDCLRDPKCWDETLPGFSKIFRHRLVEIEGAPPSRFFKDTVTFSLRRLDNDGNFLRVLCIEENGSRRPCDDDRNKLQERVSLITLLDSQPLRKRSKEPLYHADNWELTDAGRDRIRRMKTRYPDFWKKVAHLISGSLSQPD